MKKIALSSLLLFVTLFTMSQVPKGNFKSGAGLSLAIPASNLDISSVGGGIDILVQYGLTEKIAITADAGFTGLPGKGKYPSTAIVPIRLGARFFPLTKVYLAAKAGIGIYTILKASANYTAFSASMGYLVLPKLDAAAYYDGYTNSNSTFGIAGLRIGYQF